GHRRPRVTSHHRNSAIPATLRFHATCRLTSCKPLPESSRRHAANGPLIKHRDRHLAVCISNHAATLTACPATLLHPGSESERLGHGDSASQVPGTAPVLHSGVALPVMFSEQCRPPHKSADAQSWCLIVYS